MVKNKKGVNCVHKMHMSLKGYAMGLLLDIKLENVKAPHRK